LLLIAWHVKWLAYLRQQLTGSGVGCALEVCMFMHAVSLQGGLVWHLQMQSSSCWRKVVQLLHVKAASTRSEHVDAMLWPAALILPLGALHAH
jgi:hypothetical protein